MRFSIVAASSSPGQTVKDLLTADHQEVDSILKLLFAAFDNVDADGVRLHLDYFWARLAMHIRAEDVHLFPAVLRAFRGRNNSGPSMETVATSLLNLDNDHSFFMRELGAAVKLLFDLREDAPDEQARKLAALREKMDALCRRLELHNQQEEGGVYEWAETLGVQEITALSVKIRRELANLPPRFKKAGVQP